MRKYLKILAYMGGIAGATALGSIFGSVWGFVAFGSSFLVGASVFVMTDGVNFFSNKSTDKTSRFNANMKDDETYDMEETLGKYKGTYLSNAKKKEEEKTSLPEEQYAEDLKSGKRKPEMSPNETKNHHSKLVPSSQGVKSRKPIEDDFEITM